MPYAPTPYETEYEYKYEERGGRERKKYKSESVKDFLHTRKGREIINFAKKAGFKKRGVVELLILIWTLFDSDEDLAKEVMKILKQLKGVDGLNTLLKILKLKSDTLDKR